MREFDLTTEFNEFYAALAAEKQALGPATGERLLSLLERQALAWRTSHGELAVELYRHAQYVMAALADEALLNCEWAGREEWRGRLLETRLFGTYRAGELFFARLDALLAKRDPIYSELARIYLLALILGFEGKWRGREGAEAELARYRRQLFRLIFQRDPELRVRPEPLFPAAYAVTLDEGAGRHLPYLKPWLLLIGLIAVFWVAASVPLWDRLSADLETILKGILA